jgi:transposase
MYEAAAFVIKSPERGAFGHVTTSGDPDMIAMASAGPVHPGRSAGQNTQWPFEPAVDPPRGFNARERRVAALPRDGKNLKEISATFSTGYKTAAKLKLRPRPAPPSPSSNSRSNKTERRDTAQGGRLLHPKSWRVLLFDAARAGPKTVEIAKSAASRANSAAIDAAGIQAKLKLVVDATGSGLKTASRTADAAR